MMTRICTWDNPAEELGAESQEVVGQGCQDGQCCQGGQGCQDGMGELVTHGCNSLLVGRT